MLSVLLVSGQLFAMDARARLAITALCENVCAEESAKHAARLRLLDRSSKLARSVAEKKHFHSKGDVDDRDVRLVDKVALQMSLAVDAAFKKRLELIQNIRDSATSLEEAQAKLSGLEDLENELCVAICKREEDAEETD